MPRLPLATTAIVAALVAGAAIAQQNQTPEEAAVAARESHMRLYAFHLGPLGGMAQEAIPYDAEMAQRAADALVALASFDQDLYWIPGTAQGEVEGSEALPAIWENYEDFEAHRVALEEAAVAMQAAAGTDLAGLQGAMGGLGGACGACHESYRAED
jgi:cytochrome c556